MTREAWIIDGVRTPRGKGRLTGGLHGVHPQELLAQCLRALRDRTAIDPLAVEDVIVGNVSGIGDHAACIGRLAVLAAGWPEGVPGLTINRFCGSGQQAVSLAAFGVLSGMQDLVVGGGVESMSRWPPEPTVLTIDGANPALRAKFPVVPQGISADLIATVEGYTREQCDEVAVRSQARAGTAMAEGRFEGSIIPVTAADGTMVLDHDEHPRPGTTLESLATLGPAFEELGTTMVDGYDCTFDAMCSTVYPSVDRVRHVHHAGNSSGIVDGAAAVLVASSDFASAHGLAPRARIRSVATAGSEPVIMLTGPAAAARMALGKAGMSTRDVDVWEINEAFAAVVLKAAIDLGLDPAVVNPNGGAIALGHPIGATGAMLIQTALDELERSNGTVALVAMCTGGGMATATVIERI